MKQSETPHALKHRIAELEEEVQALNRMKFGPPPKGGQSKKGAVDPPSVAIGAPGDLMDIQNIAHLSVLSPSLVPDQTACFDMRRGGTYNRRGLWLGNIARLRGYHPEIRIDEIGDYVLVFVRT